MSTSEIAVTLKQVMDSIGAFNELVNVPLPAATSFNVRKVASAVEEERKTVIETINRRREELSDDGGEISDDNLKKLNEELAELMDKEIVIKGNKVHISDFGTASVKPLTLMALDWFVIG